MTAEPGAVTWADLAARASDDPAQLDRLAEVPGLLHDWYADELSQREQDTAGHDGAKRTQYRVWADRVAETMTTQPPGASDQGDAPSRFRKYLANPDHYPGGEAGLLADALHRLALYGAQRRSLTELTRAKEALSRAEDRASAGQWAMRDGCWLCGRNHGELRRLGAADLHPILRNVCDTCAKTARDLRTEWGAVVYDVPENAW